MNAPTWRLHANAAPGRRSVTWRENLASVLESSSVNQAGWTSMPHRSLRGKQCCETGTTTEFVDLTALTMPQTQGQQAKHELLCIDRVRRRLSNQHPVTVFPSR